MVVKKDTGELEGSCEVCGIKGIGNDDDPSIIATDENHTTVEVSQEEVDAMSASLREGEEPHIIEYGVKLDPARMKRTLAERARPESIVTERKKKTVDIKRK